MSERRRSIEAEAVYLVYLAICALAGVAFVFVAAGWLS